MPVIEPCCFWRNVLGNNTLFFVLSWFNRYLGWNHSRSVYGYENLSEQPNGQAHLWICTGKNLSHPAPLCTVMCWQNTPFSYNGMFLFCVWDGDASSIAFIIAIVPGIGVRFPASFAVVLHDVNSNLTFHISWVLLYPHSFFFRAISLLCFHSLPQNSMFLSMTDEVPRYSYVKFCLVWAANKL